MSDRFILEIEYKRLAKKYNLTEKQVKEIFESQFVFSRQAMKEGIHNDVDSFKNINFIKLGKIYVKKGVIERYRKVAEYKLNKEKEDGQSSTN